MHGLRGFCLTVASQHGNAGGIIAILLHAHVDINLSFCVYMLSIMLK